MLIKSVELPDMDKQRELAKIFRAIETTKKTYQKLLQKIDELVKSKFIELLKGWFCSLISQINGGIRYGKISF
ncbi:hypothetical protein A8990_11489 [Paenibacillus taihuensis]|uniref:Type I restriction enzyme S subunit n=1 Tax=Paenibacillus taihuensis TaxID=1156355 RepID=A0A3D9S3P8_9BACL|nr:hypothetical protein A8990_11489 [Paenibacillus taihuensis]